MDSRERILAVLDGEKPDTTPIFPKIAFANIVACQGMTVRDYMTDPECMARACIGAYRRFGWDGVSLHTDISSEGMALGTVYERPESTPPVLKKYLLNSLEEVEKIRIPNPYTAESMKVVTTAVRLVKEEIGKETYILAWTNGPLNVASQLYNMDELLASLIEEPKEVHALLKLCTQTACAYAEALIAMGADAIAYGHATASPNVISRDCYREFALPYEKRLVDCIHQNGARAFTHICGNVEPIIDMVSENGSDVIDFDHVCDIDRLREKAPGKVFRGNINPTLFAMGKPEEIREKVRQLLEQRGTDRRFFLGSGCEINLNTPPENLQAFVDAGREFGRK